jgi:hypothetical protein
MRNTLIIGLLMCLPTVVLLASASLAVLIGKLRQGPTCRFSGLPMAKPDREKFRDAVNRPTSVPAGH